MSAKWCPRSQKLRKWTPGGGVDEVTFSTFFHQFSFLGPLGAPGGPEVRFLIDLDRFWATLARFRNDFWITFPRFFDPASTWEPRPSDRSIHRAIDFSSIFYPCLADFFRYGLPCTIHFASETGPKKILGRSVLFWEYFGELFRWQSTGSRHR